MEKVFGPKAYNWDKEFDPSELADYKIACQSQSLSVMHKYLLGQIRFLRDRNNEISVLDGGCGYARWVIYLNRQGISCVGVDKNEKVVSQVKQFDPGLPLRVGDLRELPFRNDSFDLVYSFGVLEHLEEGMDKALIEIYRVLKPGGRVLITVPTINWIKGATKPLRAIRSNLKKKRAWCFRESRYTKKEVMEALHKNNFRTVTCDVSDESGIGLWEDFAFLRQPGIFKLNKLGRLICEGFNLISPWITTWGILVIGEKK
ncbi:MAG: class I SAM-dependent methyltransferase [bacterium]